MFDGFICFKLTYYETKQTTRNVNCFEFVYYIILCSYNNYYFNCLNIFRQ